MRYQKRAGAMSSDTRHFHMALESLNEELETVNWYEKLVRNCEDPELKSVLAHNRDEEREHASMLLEWIRRKDTSFSEELADYLFMPESGVHD